MSQHPEHPGHDDAPLAGESPSATDEADAGPVDPFEEEGDSSAADELAVARATAEEHLGDLQRLQAEYVNYRRRVDRDRDVARTSATTSVLEGILPVLDDVELARQHGDLEGGPFAAISEKLEAALGRFGLTRYGMVGEVFDPSVHEALMHSESTEVSETVVTTVLQPGYKVGEKVLRPARVAVTSPA